MCSVIPTTTTPPRHLPLNIDWILVGILTSSPAFTMRQSQFLRFGSLVMMIGMVHFSSVSALIPHPHFSSLSGFRPSLGCKCGLYRRGRATTIAMANNVTQEFRDAAPQLPALGISFGIDEVNGGLLACDMFAILIASQLMGLLDVLNDPEFARNGGWFQPIPAVPSTLGILAERVALNGALWFPSSFVRVSLSTKKDTEQAGSDWFLDALPTLILFSTFRVAIGIAVLHDEAALLHSLRDCYFVGLATVSFRFLFQRYFA